MVALAPPLFVTVSVWLWLWPTTTLVNVMLAGDGAKMAGSTATPLPESATSSVVLESLLLIDKVPLFAPATVGAKTTPKVVL